MMGLFFWAYNDPFESEAFYLVTMTKIFSFPKID